MMKENDISEKRTQILDSTDDDQEYTIEIYEPLKNEEDRKFIHENSQILWKFFDEGYKEAGLKGFLSCNSNKSLRKNAVLLKIAYLSEMNIPIAMSIYSGRNGGYKCVCITATTNKFYRDLGKKAAKEIIKYDMQHYNLFYWIECDEHIKRMCERRGGIPIPNVYAYLLDDRMIPDDNDEYRCWITLTNDETYEKYIFGFNTIDTYNEIVKLNDERVMQYIKKTDFPIYESTISTYDEFDKSIRIINILYDERNEVSGCFSPKIIEIIKKTINTLKTYVPKGVDKDKDYRVWLAIENGQDIIDCSTILELHEF